MPSGSNIRGPWIIPAPYPFTHFVCAWQGNSVAQLALQRWLLSPIPWTLSSPPSGACSSWSNGAAWRMGGARAAEPRAVLIPVSPLLQAGLLPALPPDHRAGWRPHQDDRGARRQVPAPRPQRQREATAAATGSGRGAQSRGPTQHAPTAAPCAPALPRRL